MDHLEILWIEDCFEYSERYQKYLETKENLSKKWEELEEDIANARILLQKDILSSEQIKKLTSKINTLVSETLNFVNKD